MTRTVVVVGGGISGLATAHHLRALRPDAPPEVVVLEGRERAGGKVRTDTDGGCVREWGPNGFLDSVPETLDLVRTLGLEGRLRRAGEKASERFLWKDGGLWRLPGSQGEFLSSGLLSLRARLRVLLEPFAAGPPKGDESVYDFARRRIGEEPARVLVSAMTAGVFAGNARELSLRSAFPVMKAMEREHGSLLRAMKARKRAARKAGGGGGGGPFGPGGTLTTFDGGMQVLTDALAARLGGAVRVGKRVMGLAREGAQWRVQSSDGELFRADAVVLAPPAPEAALLLGRVDPRFTEPLAAIPVAPVVVVSLLYDERDAEKATRGFGFLVPDGEPARVLGVLWDSTIFEGRAPAGHALLRAMLGGARDPGIADATDFDCVALVREDLERTMGVTAEPEEVRVYRHHRGIPQYTLGHQERLERVEEIRAQVPGLFLTGNSYRGVALNLCCRDALGTARAVLGIQE